MKHQLLKNLKRANLTFALINVSLLFFVFNYTIGKEGVSFTTYMWFTLIGILLAITVPLMKTRWDGLGWQQFIIGINYTACTVFCWWLVVSNDPLRYGYILLAVSLIVGLAYLVSLITRLKNGGGWQTQLKALGLAIPFLGLLVPVGSSGSQTNPPTTPPHLLG